MKNLHICFLQYNLRGGGAERKVCTLANYFAEQGHRVEIGLFGVNTVAYSLHPDIRLTFLRRENYEYRSTLEKLLFSAKKKAVKAALMIAGLFSKQLGKRIETHFHKKFDYTQPIRRFIENRPDAVFISMMAQAYNEIMRIIEKDVKSGKLRIPYIVMECSNPTPGLDANARDDGLRKKYYPMASRCVAMTQGVVNLFDERIREKSMVIPNPLRGDLPALYSGKRRNTVVNYCRLHRAKNLPLLIDAFAAFHQKHPEFSLEIYGEGDLQEGLLAQIDRLGLSKVAHIYPFDPAIHQKIRDCAMFVSSSDWEGFPNSVMEAMAIGLPTISTDCDFGPRDMIRDHENGLLVPVGDADALSGAMAELANDPALSARMSQEAVKARETYRADTIGQRWLSLIEEVKTERKRT